MFHSNTPDSDDFSMIEKLFAKYKFNSLYEQVRLRLLVVKDSFRDKDEFENIVEEVLLISDQEGRKLDVNSFYFSKECKKT
ncbi:TPA: hypothetical protein ACLBZV_005556 [Bacillus cereus]|uniref:hypothetical protein n=1 Tax=Bacillus cereus TaxID=1396 RepID=UPI001F3EE33F|nr:hypothetical protein [Bacillus cereus]BCC15195.1 hypothetical protein BCM0074_p315 [Bacillus cereus]HDR6306418.1 hypothetical protein [Bacillus cereus]